VLKRHLSLPEHTDVKTERGDNSSSARELQDEPCVLREKRDEANGKDMMSVMSDLLHAVNIMKLRYNGMEKAFEFRLNDMGGVFKSSMDIFENRVVDKVRGYVQPFLH
jgi:hypothetical protein